MIRRMYLKPIFIAFIFSTVICSSSAIQCHQCKFENFTSQYQGQFGCMDPFQSPGIEVVDCADQCYANITEVTAEFFTYEAVYRGCATDADIQCEHFQGCQDVEGTRFCVYCCNNENGCNSKSFEEVDQSTTKCYQCQAELTADGMPADESTCGRSDFDGTGDNVFDLPCSSGTCISFTTPENQGNPSSITRTCAVEGLLDFCENEETYEAFFGYNIDCCNGNLCNVGGGGDASPNTDATPITEKTTISQAPVTDLPLIECWQCHTNLTSDGLPPEGSSCGSGDLDGTEDGVLLQLCPSGVCITLIRPPNEVLATPSLTRTCAIDLLLDFCDTPLYYETVLGYEVECCNEDKCNTGSSVFPVTTELVTTKTPEQDTTPKATTKTPEQDTTPIVTTKEQQDHSSITKESKQQTTKSPQSKDNGSSKVIASIMSGLLSIIAYGLGKC